MRKAETALRTLGESLILSAMVYLEVRAMVLFQAPAPASQQHRPAFCPGPWRVPPLSLRDLPLLPGLGGKDFNTRLFRGGEKSMGLAIHPVKRETRQVCVLVIYVRNFPQGMVSLLTIHSTLPICSLPVMGK